MGVILFLASLGMLRVQSPIFDVNATSKKTYVTPQTYSHWSGIAVLTKLHRRDL